MPAKWAYAFNFRRADFSAMKWDGLSASITQRKPSPLARHADAPLSSRPMIGLLQRVTHAEVRVDEPARRRDRAGLAGTGRRRARRRGGAGRPAAGTAADLRVFPDAEGRMNRSLQDIGGGCCWFRNSRWPRIRARARGPASARRADPTKGDGCSTTWCERARERTRVVQTGEFGADMQVSLTNDGPVTFWLQCRRRCRS